MFNIGNHIKYGFYDNLKIVGKDEKHYIFAALPLSFPIAAVHCSRPPLAARRSPLATPVTTDRAKQMVLIVSCISLTYSK